MYLRWLKAKRWLSRVVKRRQSPRKSFKAHLLAAPLEGIEIERSKDTDRHQIDLLIDEAS